MPSPSQNFTRRVYHGRRGADGDHPYRADPPAAALEGLAVFTAATALFLLIGTIGGPGLATLAVAQGIALAGVPIAWAIARGQPRVRLGLGAPGARAMIGASLIGASLWYVNVRIAEPIVRAFGADELARLGARFAGPPLALRLLVVAILPACCEELLSRGVLARALRPATGRIVAVLVSALCFASFHLSIVRFVPTFTLGAVLAAVTLAADSVWPAIAAHALNNAIAIAVTGGELAPVAGMVSAHPDACLIASAALSVAGLVIALARRPPV